MKDEVKIKEGASEAREGGGDGRAENPLTRAARQICGSLNVWIVECAGC